MPACCSPADEVGPSETPSRAPKRVERAAKVWSPQASLDSSNGTQSFIPLRPGPHCSLSEGWDHRYKSTGMNRHAMHPAERLRGIKSLKPKGKAGGVGGAGRPPPVGTVKPPPERVGAGGGRPGVKARARDSDPP